MEQKSIRQEKRKAWSETWNAFKDQINQLTRSEKRRLFRESWRNTTNNQIVVDGHSKATNKVLKNDVRYQKKKEHRDDMKKLFPGFW